MGTFRPIPLPSKQFNMRGWNRPTARIYASNGSPAYSSSISSESRSARATSVAAGSQSASASSFVRSSSVAPASSSIQGYSGIYGRQLALLNEKSASAKSAAKYDAAFTSSSASARKISAAVASSRTTSVQEKTTTTVEKSASTTAKVDLLKAQKSSIEYGKSSKCAALRRAEIHAQNSGKDPRHVPVPRNVDDDICYLVADIHLSPYSGKEVSSASSMSNQGRLKIERMEKELSALTSSAMSYKSMYAKSASQMAAEAMSACESEATSSKTTRKTVIESSRKQVAAA